jgi:hypothetical protein
MEDYYPRFSVELANTTAGRMAIWTGEVQPIQTEELLWELLDDLDHDRPVYLPGGGRVIHHPHCFVWKHARPVWFKRVTNPYVTYRLKIKYLGGPQHPRGYVTSPILLPFKNGRFHWKHNLEDGAMCVYAPHQNVWNWEQHTVVDFMSHALLWLVKWTVWDQADVWLGAEAPHDPYSLVRTIKPEDPCRCGMGKEYGKCHREQDLAFIKEHPEPKRLLSDRITELIPRLFA